MNKHLRLLLSDGVELSSLRKQLRQQWADKIASGISKPMVAKSGKSILLTFGDRITCHYKSDNTRDMAIHHTGSRLIAEEAVHAVKMSLAKYVKDTYDVEFYNIEQFKLPREEDEIEFFTTLMDSVILGDRSHLVMSEMEFNEIYGQGNESDVPADVGLYVEMAALVSFNDEEEELGIGCTLFTDLGRFVRDGEDSEIFKRSVIISSSNFPA